MTGYDELKLPEGICVEKIKVGFDFLFVECKGYVHIIDKKTLDLLKKIEGT